MGVIQGAINQALSTVGSAIDTSLDLKAKQAQVAEQKATTAELQKTRAEEQARAKLASEVKEQEAKLAVSQNIEKENKAIIDKAMSEAQPEIDKEIERLKGLNEEKKKQGKSASYSIPYMTRGLQTQAYQKALERVEEYNKTPARSIELAYVNGEYKSNLEYRKAHLDALIKESKPDNIMTADEYKKFLKKGSK